MSRIIVNSFASVEKKEAELIASGSIASGIFASVDAGKYDGTADKQNGKPMFAILTTKQQLILYQPLSPVQLLQHYP